jgi:hypothetical protein
MKVPNWKKYAMCDYSLHSFKSNNFEVSDIVINEDNEIGVIIQIRDNDEYRTDMFGNCCTSEIKLATEQQINEFRPNVMTDGSKKYVSLVHLLKENNFYPDSEKYKYDENSYYVIGKLDRFENNKYSVYKICVVDNELRTETFIKSFNTIKKCKEYIESICIEKQIENFTNTDELFISLHNTEMENYELIKRIKNNKDKFITDEIILSDIDKLKKCADTLFEVKMLRLKQFIDSLKLNN